MMACPSADTPGVHLQHRLQHLLEPALTKQLLPKGKLKPFLPPSPQELAFQAQLGTSSPTRLNNQACYVESLS